MSNIKKEIGKRIRQVRAKLKLTQEQFAVKTKSTKSSISAYELGDVLPSLQVAIEIARIGDVSLDWLLRSREVSGQVIADGLTIEENRVLEAFRKLNNIDQRALLRVIEGMTRYSHPQEG